MLKFTELKKEDNTPDVEMKMEIDKVGDMIFYYDEIPVFCVRKCDGMPLFFRLTEKAIHHLKSKNIPLKYPDDSASGRTFINHGLCASVPFFCFD